MHKNGVTCLKVNDTEVFTGGEDSLTFLIDMQAISKRVNEIRQMEIEDLRSRKAMAYYNYIESKTGRRRGKKGKKGGKKKKK